MVVGWNLGKGLQRSHVKDRRCEGYVSHRFFWICFFIHLNHQVMLHLKGIWESVSAIDYSSFFLTLPFEHHFLPKFCVPTANSEAYGDSLVVPLPAEPRFPGQWQVVGFGVPSDSKQFNESFSSETAILLVGLCLVAGEPPGSTGTSRTFIHQSTRTRIAKCPWFKGTCDLKGLGLTLFSESLKASMDNCPIRF